MDCLTFLLAAAADTLPAQTDPGAGGGITGRQYAALGIFFAVLIIPFLIARPIARSLRMPDYATRIGLILFALAASITVLSLGQIGLGIDLRGGTILVYEIDPTVGRAPTQDIDGEPLTRVTSADMIPSLRRRIDPANTLGIMIRPYGETQIEIIIPQTDPGEIQRIKSLLERAGILRFAILANRRDHQRLIEIARNQAEDPAPGLRLGRDIYDVDDSTIGFWATVSREDVRGPAGIQPLRVDVSNAIVRNPANGQIIDIPPAVGGGDGIAQWMASIGLERVQALMAVDPLLDITGEDLAYAASGFDNTGRPAVRFRMTDAGSNRFHALTTNNAPDGAHRRQLGIVLDDTLLSAPAIQSPISTDGQITGNFTSEEVTDLVRILEAGRLPAALTKTPIAENQIDATLGADTIRSGMIAIATSLALVLVFILFYYRFIGLIACLALVLNLMMILAVMILINQPLTLPGLAGLVLTVGMSVDANVLIFERIREELNKGSAARMAIRNGFGRATTTIVDANLTTLITAIVLYAIGTDQIRGFAVTLILGILFSMFTAIYMSRTFFDIAERKRRLSLSMSDVMNTIRNSLGGAAGFNFMRHGTATLTLSAVLLVGGIIAIVARGGTILDIDFAGGSSVTFRVQDPTPTDTVRSVVAQSLAPAGVATAEFTVHNVSMADAPAQTVFKVDSAIEDVSELQRLISRGFAADGTLRLVTYEVEAEPITAAAGPGAEETSLRSPAPSTMTLVAMRPQAEDEAAADEPPAEAQEPQEDAAPPVEAPAQVAEDDAEVAADPPQVDEADAAEAPAEPAVISRHRIRLGVEGRTRDAARINQDDLLNAIEEAAERAGVSIDMLAVELQPLGEGAEEWLPGSELRFSEWEIGLPVEAAQADQVMSGLLHTLGQRPIWISSSKVGSQVARDMIGRAFGALFASLLCIIAYIWFRFQRVIYGLAAVAALVHDVLITVGAIAVSWWLAGIFGFLLIEQFKISLTVVAALLTVIGYSLNDTIVVFDRIRETKGKSPRLTEEMVNTSINSTLSRTLLTSLTTLIVVGLLYFFGGEGIHAFAFSLVVGVLVGTYSSIFVASPILLWLVSRYQTPARASA